MKYYLWIIGCQYNEWDGARLRYFLDSLGLQEAENAKDADSIIIVACAVRQTAVDRILGRVKNWKDKQVLATGCVLVPDKKKFAEKGINIFVPGDFETLKTFLNLDSSKTNNYKPRRGPCPRGLTTNNSIYVPIMTGCNNFCSYCAVPYTRGREKSRPIEEIVGDVKKLIAAGHKEIMLLGQNVNSYKTQNSKLKTQNYNLKFQNNKTDFTKLLERLNSLEEDFEISFTSNHPKDMTDDIINAVATLEKIKKDIHLPLQSGSNKVLQSMKRPYTVEEYLKIIKKLKSKIKNLRLSTDVIVGFPTETQEDFEKTLKIFNIVNFDQAYINKYSPRAGTAAYELGDPIPWAEKQRRWRVLNDIIKR